MKRVFAITGAVILLLGAATAFAECPPAELVCATWGGCVLSAFCGGADCFEMNYAAEANLVAADEQGDYPKLWHAWSSGLFQPVGDLPCFIKHGRKHTRIEIPEVGHCSASLTTLDHLYLEFFASNQAASCFGWVECKCY